MNVSICGNPAPGKYVPGGRDWPSGNLGVVMRVMPTVDTYIMASMFAVSPHSYNGGISGWAWAQSGLGKFSTPVEFRLAARIRQTPPRRSLQGGLRL